MKKLFAPFINIGVFMLTLWLLDDVLPIFSEIFFLKQELSLPIPQLASYFIDVITHLVTYSLVGFLFSIFGWYNSDFMKIVYFSLSEVISLGLVYLMRIVIDYWWAFLIPPAVLLVLFLGWVIYICLSTSKRTNKLDKQ